jgi:xylose isomerase
MAQSAKKYRRRTLCGDLWTVRYRGSDPFGGPILDESSAYDGLAVLVEARKEGLIDLFSAHDDDLVSWDPQNPNDYRDPKSPIRSELVKLKAIVDAGELPMHMITCSLHGNPIFANGGFCNPDPAIRLLALKKAMRAAWIGDYFGATRITYWVARDGFETPAMIDGAATSPYTWLKQALDAVSFACKNNGYSIKQGTIEPKANEPRGISYLPLVGSALAFIGQLADKNFWGVNPEIPQHSAMVNASPFLEILQAVSARKLTFLHIGGQINGQFDDDFPVLFGPDNCKVMVQIFHYLEQANWDDVIEFDCHALRSDLAAGAANYRTIMRQFIRYNVMMYRTIEQVIVPRLMANDKLTRAVKQLSLPNFRHEEEKILAKTITAEKIDQIIEAVVPADKILSGPQNVLAIEEEFNRSFFGLTAETIEMAMSD